MKKKVEVFIAGIIVSLSLLMPSAAAMPLDGINMSRDTESAGEETASDGAGNEEAETEDSDGEPREEG